MLFNGLSKQNTFLTEQLRNTKLTMIESKHFIKARPKQDFNIDHSTIMNSKELTMPLRVWLYIILERHKVFNKIEYQYIPNQELCMILGVSTPTLIKQRDELERLKLIEVMCKVKGKLTPIAKAQRKNQPIYYHPNFSLLLKYGFIKPIEMSEYQKNFREATRKPNSKVMLKPLIIGEVLNYQNSKALKSNKSYNVVFKSIEDNTTSEMVIKGSYLKSGFLEEYNNKEKSDIITLFYGENKDVLGTFIEQVESLLNI